MKQKLKSKKDNCCETKNCIYDFIDKNNGSYLYFLNVWIFITI